MIRGVFFMLNKLISHLKTCAIYSEGQSLSFQLTKWKVSYPFRTKKNCRIIFRNK